MKEISKRQNKPTSLSRNIQVMVQADHSGRSDGDDRRDTETTWAWHREEEGDTLKTGGKGGRKGGSAVKRPL